VLTSWFDKYHFHELIEKRWGVRKVVDQLILDGLKIGARKLIQEDSDLANHLVESILLSKGLLPWEAMASVFLWEIQNSHIVWSQFVGSSQSEDQLNAVNFSWLLVLFSLFSLFFLRFILAFERWLVSSQWVERCWLGVFLGISLFTISFVSWPLNDFVSARLLFFGWSFISIDWLILSSLGFWLLCALFLILFFGWNS